MNHELKTASLDRACPKASRGLSVLALAAAIVAAGWLAETARADVGARGAVVVAPPLAQFDPSRSPGPTTSSGQWKLPAKIVGVVALTVAALMIACFVVFPRMLRRPKRPVGPLSAYG